MKISFVIPPVETGRTPERLYGCTYQVYPQPDLPLLYAASSIEGHEVTVRDFPVEGFSYKDFLKWMDEDDSEIYVLHTVPISKDIDLKAAQNTRKDCIFFGPGPTAEPEKFLIRDNSYVLRGEIEYTIGRLANCIDKGKGFHKLNGLSFRKRGANHNKTSGIIKNIDNIPIPNRKLIKNKLYRNPKLPRSPYTTMLTSRGCSFRCYYCVPNSLSYARELEWKRFEKGKPPVTLRTAENIVPELRDMKKLGIRSISVVDDQFIWGKERNKDLCGAFKKAGLPFGILARCDVLCDEEIVSGLAGAGCVYVDIGIESFNQGVLDYIKKDLRVESIKKSIALLNKYGIEPKLNILYGSCPLETEKDLKETLKTVKSFDVDFAQFAVCSPFPGTEFRDIGCEKGWFKNTDVSKVDTSKGSLVSFENMDDVELEKWVRHSYRSFYLRPKTIIKRMSKIRNISEFKTYFKGILNLVR